MTTADDMTMPLDPGFDGMPAAATPSDPDPALHWWRSWVPNPSLAQFFTTPPGVEGEVAEVRIRRTHVPDTYVVQVGFRPREQAED